MDCSPGESCSEGFGMLAIATALLWDDVGWRGLVLLRLCCCQRRHRALFTSCQVRPMLWRSTGSETLMMCCVFDRRPVPLPRVPPVGGALPVHRVASESAMSQ